MVKRQSIYSKNIILVMAATFFFLFSAMLIRPIINGYAEDLGASRTFAGVIVGFISISSVILRPIAGNLTDKYSKYFLSFSGGILLLIGDLGYIFTPSSDWLLPFRLANGAGFVLGTVCMSTWLAFLVPRVHVGEAMGLYGLMNASAMALAPTLAINIYPKIGYRATFIISAVSAIFMMITIQFVSNHAKPQETKKRHSFKIVQFNVLPVTVLTALFAMPYFTTQNDLVKYSQQRHLSVAIGSYFLIYAVVTFIIRLIFKKKFDTVRFGIWFWISTISTGLYLLLLTYMRTNWLMVLAAVAMSMSYGIIYSILQSTALLLAPMSEQGLASSTFYLGQDIGMGLGPIVGGIISTVLPIKYFYLMYLMIIPFAIVVYFIYRKRLNRAINNH